MSEQLMTLNLKIWRQKDNKTKGKLVDYKLENVSPESSFLEMLDQLNERLIRENNDSIEIGHNPVSFDHDCREGICGCCSLMINGVPHGPEKETTTCQLHMRKYKDGDTIVIEPFRAKAFPVVKDLFIDRSAYDEIITAGGFITMKAGNAQDANSTVIKRSDAELSMDASQCIGCGACVASCKNASAMLFVSAKVSQFALLPQGKIEANDRVISMVSKMDELGFGNCTNEKECEASCPKGIKITNIARLNREYYKAIVK